MRKTTDPEVRFWRHVNKTTTCWLWTGATKRWGYGAFRVSGLVVSAHRFSWELRHGPITSEMCVLHKCDTPRCVNPAHLEIGDRPLNSADMVRKGRSAHGERHSHARLTAETVIEFRRRVASGELARAVALDLGIPEGNVSSVLYTTWKYLPPYSRSLNRYKNSGRQPGLSVDVVTAMRVRYRSGETMTDIARTYGMSLSVVYRAIRGKGRYGLMPGAIERRGP